MKDFSQIIRKRYPHGTVKVLKVLEQIIWDENGKKEKFHYVKFEYRVELRNSTKTVIKTALVEGQKVTHIFKRNPNLRW